MIGFPKNRIIQLPQSIHFAATENLERARAALQGHSDFVVLVRVLASLKTAREVLCVEASLCPDMAFGLRALRRPGPPERDILWLARDDLEGRHLPQTGQEIDIADWLEEPESALKSPISCSPDSCGAHRHLSTARSPGHSRRRTTGWPSDGSGADARSLLRRRLS
ncbi:hypothetical protein BH18ACT14_BH18ACT14_13590 [soil metagenome]